METIIKENQIKQPMPIHSEQWRVVNESYKNTYDIKEPANRKYGTICTQIEEEDYGKVVLQYRPAAKGNKPEEWIELKCFELNYDDEEDDDEEDDD
jgi:hypothetical protein